MLMGTKGLVHEMTSTHTSYY